MPFLENRADGLVYMTSSVIGAAHAFTTRYGGVSGGIYASLNLGQNTGDRPGDVRRNYDILGAALGFNPESLALSRQVHGAEVRLVTKSNLSPPFAPIPYEADGLITMEADIPLMIFTADCIPILLYDPVGRAVGAVHAGWRGTVSDIAGRAVAKMAHHFRCRPENLRAAIGPGISTCCYETDRDVADAVLECLGSAASVFTAERDGKFMIDLKGVNSHLLEQAGLKRENIDISPECTSCLSEKYWSHRVTRGRRGSQVSVIMMKGHTT